MADKFMYISNDETQNYPFCRLLIKTAQFPLPSWVNVSGSFERKAYDIVFTSSAN